jgi:hypothetical protein
MRSYARADYMIDMLRSRSLAWGPVGSFKVGSLFPPPARMIVPCPLWIDIKSAGRKSGLRPLHVTLGRGAEGGLDSGVNMDNGVFARTTDEQQSDVFAHIHNKYRRLWAAA